MSDLSTNAIETAIKNLSARQPKPRGRREILAPYVPQLRALLAAGWSRAEIVAEIKAAGAKMSPALLRDVLQINSNKPLRLSKAKLIKPHGQPGMRPKIATAANCPPPAMAANSHDEQQTPQTTASYIDRPTTDTGLE